MHAGISRSRLETVKGPKRAALVLLKATTNSKTGYGKDRCEDGAFEVSAGEQKPCVTDVTKPRRPSQLVLTCVGSDCKRRKTKAKDEGEAIIDRRRISVEGNREAVWK